MSRHIFLSNEEKVIDNTIEVTKNKYLFIRHFLNDNCEVTNEFYRLKSKYRLNFFSLFIIDNNLKRKYYFSSNKDWNDYYIKHELINYDHLYQHAFSVLDNKMIVPKLIHWNSCPIITPESKDVDVERKMYGKYGNGFGLAYKSINYIEISGIGGAVDDHFFCAKMPVSETKKLIDLTRKLMIGL
ncbi:hypothetical protein L3V79_09245 [Thiotrichales bacterium 19S9-12]|nr:hypothetical protein [Thiotrichales bacterium 19S9-11]MCF6812543.1 hypothetical protein [Thiotrichales bacterium 19S9-12]